MSGGNGVGVGLGRGLGRRLPLALALGSLVLVSASLSAQAPAPLSEPVDFALEETSGQTRTLAAVRGRVVFLFYEDRDHASVNRDFKALLHRFVIDNRLSDATTTYAVANVGGIGEGFARDIARTAIRAIASQYGIQILLDWDGALRRPPFSFRDAEANVAILDRLGRIRWRHTGSVGRVEQTAFFRTLRQLLREDAR